LYIKKKIITKIILKKKYKYIFAPSWLI